MTKAQMIASMVTANISQEYLNELNMMTEPEVRKEYLEFGRTMKD